MLTQSLLLTRDLLLSGSAALEMDKPLGVPTWAGGHDGLPHPGRPGAIQRLQPNIRAVLAEMDLLAGLKFASGTEPRFAQLSAGETPLLQIAAPSRAHFEEQLKLVHSFADLRGERTSEVLAQAVPQTASWSAVAGLQPERHRYTWELLGIGLRFAMMMVMRFKQALECPRPMEYSALVQPMILTPGYTAFPSGHAAESYFIAELLPLLAAKASGLDGRVPTAPDFRALAATSDSRETELGERQGSLRAQLYRLAYRISENRVVAGLHFPIDSVAGQLLGVILARYFAGFCGLGKDPALLVGHTFASGTKFLTVHVEPKLDRGVDHQVDDRIPITPGKKPVPAGDSRVLAWLTDMAKSEWRD